MAQYHFIEFQLFPLFGSKAVLNGKLEYLPSEYFSEVHRFYDSLSDEAFDKIMLEWEKKQLPEILDERFRYIANRRIAQLRFEDNSWQ